MRELYIAGIKFKKCQIYVICRTGIEVQRVCEGFSSLSELIEWSKVHRLLVYPERTGNIRGIIEYFIVKKLLQMKGICADLPHFVAACYSSPVLRKATEPYADRIEKHMGYIEQIVNSY